MNYSEYGINIYTNTNINLNHQNYFNRTKSQILKYDYGYTALKNARKNLEKLRGKKELEIYVMMNHRIETAFQRQATYDKYNFRQRCQSSYQNEMKKNKKIGKFDFYYKDGTVESTIFE